MWRSLVAYTAGGRVVAGSNPVIPTNHFLSGIKALLTDWLTVLFIFNEFIRYHLISYKRCRVR